VKQRTHKQQSQRTHKQLGGSEKVMQNVYDLIVILCTHPTPTPPHTPAVHCCVYCIECLAAHCTCARSRRTPHSAPLTPHCTCARSRRRSAGSEPVERTCQHATITPGRERGGGGPGVWKCKERWASRYMYVWGGVVTVRKVPLREG